MNYCFQLKAEVFHPKYKLNPSIGSHDTDSYDEKYKILYNEVFQLQQLSQGVSRKSGRKHMIILIMK